LVRSEETLQSRLLGVPGPRRPVLDSGRLAHQLLDRVDRIARPGTIHFEAAQPESRVAGDGQFQHRDAVTWSCDQLVTFVRWNSRRNEEDLLKIECLSRLLGNREVCEVHRIERSPEHTPGSQGCT